MTTPNGGSSNGPAIDRDHNPVFDPTANVISLTQAVEDRQNDKHIAAAILTRELVKSVREELKLRAKHADQVRRLDQANNKSIRLVDITNAAAQQAQALLAVQVLESKRQADADNLRNALIASNTAGDKRVTDLAATLAEQKAISDRHTNDSIAALQKGSNISEGRQAYTDPALVALVGEMKALHEQQSSSKGSGEGMGKLGGWIFSGIAAFGVIAGLVITIVVLLVK